MPLKYDLNHKTNTVGYYCEELYNEVNRHWAPYQDTQTGACL